MAKSNYRDIPGARYLPGAPALKTAGTQSDRKGLHIATKISIAVAVISLLAALLILFSTNNVYNILNWAWLTTALVSVFAVSLCVLIMLGLRKVSKSNWTKLILTCVMVLVLCFAGIFGYTFTVWIYQASDVPVEYIENDNGTRVVIMKAGYTNDENASPDNLPTSYTAYQMCNKFMYLYNEAGHIYAPNDFTPEYAYEWIDDSYLCLYLPEHEGYVDSEICIPLYDLNDLETSIEARYNESLSATQKPEYTEYADIEPTAEPSPFDY